jgi:capsular exopolysaccharide synthesis family protein
MSRIHDALTKAEQETPPSLSAGLQPATAPDASPLGAGDFPVRPWTPDPARLIFTDSPSTPGTLGAGSAGREEARAIEQLRSLRSRVYQLHAKMPLHSILVSSALGGEGKTFISANFALALAKQKRKTLLIDADLRKPGLHQLFGAAPGPGLTEYLAGAAGLAEVIQGGSIENLWLMPAGAPVPNAAELLGNQRIAGVLEKLTPLFDWIVLDSSPVLPVSDAAIIARSCDAVLLVTRAEVTPYDSVQRAQHEFREARVLGLVLNGATAPGHGAYYYAGYGYGKGKTRGTAPANGNGKAVGL